MRVKFYAFSFCSDNFIPLRVSHPQRHFCEPEEQPSKSGPACPEVSSVRKIGIKEWHRSKMHRTAQIRSFQPVKTRREKSEVVPFTAFGWVDSFTALGVFQLSLKKERLLLELLMVQVERDLCFAVPFMQLPGTGSEMSPSDLASPPPLLQQHSSH